MHIDGAARLVLVGAGGHGKVVLATVLAQGLPSDRIVIVDARANEASLSLLGLPVIGGAPEAEAGDGFHIAIGSAAVRARLFAQLASSGFRPRTIVHAAASVAAQAGLADGAFVAARAVVGPDARVGAGAIVNHGAIVDHDCVVGDFAHIAPTATLGGEVRVGPRSLVGAGAVILPGVRVGADVTIGAGSVVLHDVDDGSKLVGVPARRFL